MVCRASSWQGQHLSLRQQHAAGQTLVGGAGLCAGDFGEHLGFDARPYDGSGLHNGLG
jgi:hypothetical protein